jgi:hypothetical protein
MLFTFGLTNEDVAFKIEFNFWKDVFESLEYFRRILRWLNGCHNLNSYLGSSLHSDTMDIKEKLVRVLQSLGYKVYEDIELKGSSGLSYAVDVYAIKEDPFARIRVAAIIVDSRLTKDLVLHAKMLYSDVKELDRVILVAMDGIDKEAYKLAEYGFQVLIVSPKFIDQLYQKLQSERVAESFREEEFTHHAFRILVDEAKAKKLARKYLLHKRLGGAKILETELVYRPFYLVYYRAKLDDKEIFSGIAVDAVSGKMETALNKIVSSAPSLVQKRLLRPEDVPVEIQEPQLSEDRVKELVEHILLGNNPQIVKSQLVYVPIWRFKVKHAGKILVLEIDAVSGEVLSSIDEKPTLADKFWSYLVAPELILEDLLSLGKLGYSRLSERDKWMLIYVLVVIVLVALLLLL